VCVEQFALAAGQAASSGNLCQSGYVDPSTHKCATTRVGATVATGGVCTDDSNCTAASDMCACTGDRKGVCATLLTSDFIADFRAAQKCIEDHSCPNDQNPYEAGSCISTHCQDEFEAVECDQMQLFVKFQNGGKALTGDVATEFNKNLDALYNCDSVQHGGLGAGAIVAIVVGAVVVIGLAAYFMTQRRKAREAEMSQYAAMA